MTERSRVGHLALALGIAACAATTAGATSASGVVVDGRGEPVAGATVEVLVPTPLRRPLDEVALVRDVASRRAVLDTTVSDASGRFYCEDLPVGSCYCLVARKVGSVTGVATFDSSEGDAGLIRIQLGAGHRVTGSVVRRDGTPARGVLVVALSTGRGDGPDPPDKPLTRTDHDGRFEFDAIAEGSWKFVAAPQGEGRSRLVDVQVPRAEPVSLELDGTGTLTGRVTDGDGVAVAGARVVVAFSRCADSGQDYDIGTALDYSATTTTDGSGCYSLRGLSTNAAEMLVVEAAGFCRYRGSVPSGEQERRCDVLLTLGGSLRGVVREFGTGDPVAGVSITALSSSTLRGGAPSTLSAADGSFEIRGLSIETCLIVADRAGWRQFEAPKILPLLQGLSPSPGEGTPVDPGSGPAVVVTHVGALVQRTLQMFRPARITGRVIGLDGLPVSRVLIAAVQEGEPVSRTVAVYRWAATGEVPCLTDDAGAFDVESPVPAGRVLVEARYSDPTSNSPRHLRSSVVVDIVASQPPEPLEIRLGRGTSIAGRITDAETGQPLRDVWVGWWNAEKSPGEEDLDEDSGFTRSAADGTYRLEAVTPGRVRVETRGTTDRRYVWTTREFTTDPDEENAIDWALLHAMSISGRAVYADGRPAAGAWVKFSAADQSPGAPPPYGAECAPTSEDGTFEIRCLPPGRYRISARIGYPVRETDVTIAKAGTRGVDLRFPAE